MRRIVIRLSDDLDRLCRVLAAGCFIGMLIFVTIQVVARYILQEPPSWTEELARFAMIWGGLLGATVAFKAHFDPVLAKPPAPERRLLSIGAAVLRALAVLIFIGPVLYFSLFGTDMDPARGFLGRSALRTADTLGFSLAYITAAVPLAAAVILLHLLARGLGDPGRGDPS